MKKQEITYQFGRMNIIINYSIPKEDFIKSFFNDSSFKKDNHTWKFSNIEKHTINDNIYFSGILVKYIDKSIEEIIDGNKISSTEITNKLKGKSNFFIECKTGLIAFAPDNGSISAKQFKEKFTELCRISLDSALLPVEISTIDEKRSVLERIKELDTITSVKIKLRPSNPSPSKDWEKFDKRLQLLNVNAYSASYTSESGINFEAANDIKSKIAMASDGYGQATIQGKHNGSTKIVSTQNRPITETIYQDTEILGEKVYNIIIKTFKNIQKRVHKDEKH